MATRTLRICSFVIATLGLWSATASANEPLGRDPGRFNARVEPVQVIALPEWPKNGEHPVKAIARQLDEASRLQREQTETGWSVGLSQKGLAVVLRFR